MAWSLWSACDESGLQMRSRVCDAQGSAPCVGNSTQRRDCNEIPGESLLKVQTRAGRRTHERLLFGLVCTAETCL